MRVFITGGSGFIGRRMVEALIEDDHDVVCLSRSGKSSKMLADLGARVVSGDLTDKDSLHSSIREAAPTHVAHLAAEIATQRNRERIEQVNVVGTRDLIDACRGIELEKFLFLSSVVRGDAAGKTLTEDDPIAATTDYGRSKEKGDELVLEAHRDQGLPAVVLRPSHVYGAGGWLGELLGSRVFRLPGSGDNLWDMVHVDDVVSAALLLLDKAPPGEVYHVVDDEPLTMKDFFDNVARESGRKPFKHAPVWVARLARGSDAVTAATRSARSTNDKLKALGWTPKYPRSSEAIAAVVREIDSGGAGTSERGTGSG